MTHLGGGRLNYVLIATGLALMLTGAGLLYSYEHEEALAGQNARTLLVDLQRVMEAERLDIAKANMRTQAEGQMPQIMVDGYATVGTLSVESVGLKLPILEGWSYELLQVSPCRYSGTAEDGNLILLGHSYRDHFQPLKEARIGDVVEFCDAAGELYFYEVAQTEVLEEHQLDELTNSGYDLTLFTCTFTGESRYVLRCSAIVPSS